MVNIKTCNVYYRYDNQTFTFIQLKRIKQIEQEKEVLMHGLQAVERARDWYHKQIAAVQEKMKYLGRTNSHTVSFTLIQIIKLVKHCKLSFV